MLINQTDFEKLLSQGNMTVNADQYKKFYTYSKLLVEWNEKINLTAITDPEGIALKHFYDSLYPFTLTDIDQGASVIDVGTGAGFPSCPLKIMRNDLNLTLLDSLNKRIGFLRKISEELNLNADCAHGRAEELGKTVEYREKYDIACARAVANLSELCEYCLPFVRINGKFIALKGSSGREELNDAKNAMKILGGELELLKEYTLPNGDGRTLIVIKKIAPTPEKYPRNKGQMKKKPLVNR